jgi:hypothetical protein
MFLLLFNSLALVRNINLFLFTIVVFSKLCFIFLVLLENGQFWHIFNKTRVLTSNSVPSANYYPTRHALIANHNNFPAYPARLTLRV